ncbi:MAG: NACHT domain-containing protein [Desulfurivibrionaceae bacterium]
MMVFRLKDNGSIRPVSGLSALNFNPPALAGGCLVKKALDSVIDYSKKKLTSPAQKEVLEFDYKNINESIENHIASLNVWANEISFRDLKKAKYLHNIYIPLDIYVYPRRIRIDMEENIEKKPIEQIFEKETKHCVLIGQPGAGKTTSIKYLCSKIMNDETFYEDLFNFPIVLKFRELNKTTNKSNDTTTTLSESIIFKKLFSILGLRFANIKKGSLGKLDANAIMAYSVIKFLDELKVLLVLEGFDELNSEDERTVAMNEIRTLSNQLFNSSMIITSRTGDFPYHIDNCSHFEISPLEGFQIKEFANKWLGSPEDATQFLKAVEMSPFSDTTIRPLTLAHLCAIYERAGNIPDKPKTVYKKVVNLLLEEWDEQRSIKRTSRYAFFEIDRKFEFLCHMAYELTTLLNRNIFSRDDLISVYETIYINYDLNKNEAKSVIDEIESHNGLFFQSGYEMFEFAHKSIQEYLTAEYIVRLPRLPIEKKQLEMLPNELAIAITISSNPSDYLTELVLNGFSQMNFSKVNAHSNFFSIFVNRLLQEKPVFNSSDTVILSMIILYSMYLEGNNLAGSAQLRLPFAYNDNLIPQFEKLITILDKRNSKDIVCHYYQRQKETTKLGNIEVYVLRKIRDLEKKSLPSQLYARSIFLERA